MKSTMGKRWATLILGLVMVLGGIGLGLYVGVWLCFIGGIIDIIEQIKAPEIESMVIAFGVVKIFGSTLFGSLSALVLVIPGYTFIVKS